MKEVVINKSYGGFRLSEKAEDLFRTKAKVGGLELPEYLGDLSHWRDSKYLIETIKELGLKESASRYSQFKIVEIPDDVDFTIESYDGKEWIAEAHRTWK